MALSYGHLDMVEEKLDVLRGHTLTSFVMTLDAPLKSCRLQWEIEMDGGRVFTKFEQSRKDDDEIIVDISQEFCADFMDKHFFTLKYTEDLKNLIIKTFP